MKPKTLCLPFLIVAFLFASEMPSVQGMYLSNDLLSFAAEELNHLISGVATGVSGNRSKMWPFTITGNNPTEAEKDGSEIGDISQRTNVTEAVNATENLAEKNGDIPQLSGLMKKVLSWISFLNILKRT